MGVTWLTFIGEGRSGHTILSAILDSHPNIRVSEEQKYIGKWWREGWTKEKILSELHKSGYGKERKKKALPGMLTYQDPLKIVSDKCGWDAVNEVRKRQAPLTILEDFGKMMGMPIKVLHTSRNPFDNISAWTDSPKYQRIYKDRNVLIRRMIKRYRRFYETAEKLIERSDVFHVRNEELCLCSEKTVRNMCEFLEVDVSDSWIKTVTKSINKTPNERGKNKDWPKDYKNRILDIIEEFPSLEYYHDKS